MTDTRPDTVTTAAECLTSEMATTYLSRELGIPADKIILSEQWLWQHMDVFDREMDIQNELERFFANAMR